MIHFQKPRAKNKIVLNQVQNKVLSLQNRIYKACKANKKSTLNACQKKASGSFDAQLECIKQACRKQNRSPGSEDETLTQEEKCALVKHLTLNPKSKPMREVFQHVSCAHGGPLTLSNYEICAKQNLVKLVLEPEWEAKFATPFAGFHVQKSWQQVFEHVLCKNRQKQTRNRFVLNGVVSERFAFKHHNALLKRLNTWPKLENQIKAWLQTGCVFSVAPVGKPEHVYHRLQSGWGERLSLLLANIELHACGASLTHFCHPKRFPPEKKSGAQVGNTWAGFKDILVVFTSSQEDLYKAKRQTELWHQNGLALSLEKANGGQSSQGFCFLGFHFVHVNRNATWTCRSHIGRQSKKNFLNHVRTKVQKNKSASSYVLIKQLTPVNLGWANYFRVCGCKKEFQNLDHGIFGMLRAWAFRRKAPGLGRNRLKQNLFPSGKTYVYEGCVHQNNWVLNGNNKHASYWDPKQSAYLHKLSWIKGKPWANIEKNVHLRSKLAFETNFNQEPDEMKVSRPDLLTGAMRKHRI